MGPTISRPRIKVSVCGEVPATVLGEISIHNCIFLLFTGTSDKSIVHSTQWRFLCYNQNNNGPAKRLKVTTKKVATQTSESQIYFLWGFFKEGVYHNNTKTEN